MGYRLRLADEAGTVLELDGSQGARVLEYSLLDPELKVSEGPAAGEHEGARVLGAQRENVVERCRVSLGGRAEDGSTTLEQARALAEQINGWLQAAERHTESGRGPAVYVALDAEDSGDWWRSPILAGRAELDPKTLDGYWRRRGRLRVDVTWVRAPYWEGAEQEVGLRSAGTEYATGGVVVQNAGDAVFGRVNYVDVDPGDLAGDLAAPVRLALANTGDEDVQRAWVGLDVGGAGGWGAPAALGHWLEAESTGAGELLPAGGLSDAQYSGGFFVRLSWAGAAETELAGFALAAATVQACGGRYFRLLARVLAGAADTRLRWAVQDSAGEADLWVGPEIVLEEGHEIQDLGVVQIGVGGRGPGDGACGGLTLTLRGRYTGEEEGGTLDLDWVQMTVLDGWRKVWGVDAATLPAGDTLVVDGMLAQVGREHEGLLYAGFAAVGGALQLWPGLAQRLYFVVEDADGAASAALGLTVQAFYRPRRLGL